MGWHTPTTAVDNFNYTADQYNDDRDNLNQLIRPHGVTTTAVDVTGSEDETTLYQTVIPGGAMGTSGMLRMTILGDYLNGAGGTAIFTIKLLFGGVTIWEKHTDDIDNHPNRHAVRIRAYIANCGFADSQFVTGHVYFGTYFGPTVGIGTLANTPTGDQGPFIVPFGSTGKLNIDTSGDQTLAVTVQNEQVTAVDLTMSFRCLWATLELVGQGA